MRIIGTIADEQQARKFSSFLRKEGIENSCEMNFNEKNQKGSFSIWVYEEDQVDNAVKHFEEFQKNPKEKKYDVPVLQAPPPPTPIEEAGNEKAPPPPPPSPIKRGISSFPMTVFFLSLCVVVFLVNAMQEISLSRGLPEKERVVVTPIQYLLFYDVPYNIIKIEEFLKKENIDKNSQLEELSSQMQSRIQDLSNTPTWKGFYELLLPKGEGVKEFSAPLFYKISRGQIWRVFTPAILHTGFLHILFNMFWLWLLGKQIEMRLPKWRYLLLIVLVAIFSNTAQYLMSGPLFLGFSGAVMGMAGFIWSRQRIAPWEGHALHPSTFLFLAIFVVGMFLLQFISYLMILFGATEFTPNIANTAHIVGGLVGVFLGRISFFSWRPS